MGPATGEELSAAAGGGLAAEVDGGVLVFVFHNGQSVRIAPRTARTRKGTTNHHTHEYGIRMKSEAALTLIAMTAT